MLRLAAIVVYKLIQHIVYKRFSIARTTARALPTAIAESVRHRPDALRRNVGL